MNEAQNSITTFDFFIALIARANVDAVPENVPNLVQALFFDNGTKPEGLPVLNFVKRNGILICEDFEMAMSTFRLCDMVALKNPDFKSAYVQNALTSFYIEQLASKFSFEQTKYVDDMVKVLKEDCNETSR